MELINLLDKWLYYKTVCIEFITRRWVQRTHLTWKRSDEELLRNYLVFICEGTFVQSLPCQLASSHYLRSLHQKCSDSELQSVKSKRFVIPMRRVEFRNSHSNFTVITARIAPMIIIAHLLLLFITSFFELFYQTTINTKITVPIVVDVVDRYISFP